VSLPARRRDCTWTHPKMGVPVFKRLKTRTSSCHPSSVLHCDPLPLVKFLLIADRQGSHPGTATAERPCSAHTSAGPLCVLLALCASLSPLFVLPDFIEADSLSAIG